MKLKLAIRLLTRFGLAVPVVTSLCAGNAFAGPLQARAMTELQALIGDAACSTDSQCRTVAIGSRACGGPDAYLAWSTSKTDAAQLRRAAQRYDAAQATEQPPGSRMSICSVLVDPGAVCRPAAGATDAGPATKSCALRSGAASPALPSR